MTKRSKSINGWKDEALFKKDLTNAIRNSNEKFAKSSGQISSPMTMAAQGHLS